MDQSWTPVFMMGLMNVLVAILLFLQIPYADRGALLFILIGGVGQGNQIMRLDSGGCVNWLIVVLNIALIFVLCWKIFVM